MQNRLSKLTVIAIIAAVLAGCGKAAYEKQMFAVKDNLTLASRFIENLHKTENDVIDGVAVMKLPLYIDGDALTFQTGAKTRVGNPISRDRIQPPSVNIPRFAYSYEMFVDMGGIDNKHPLYWYFGSAPADAKLKGIEQALRSETAKMVAKSKPSFVDVSIPTPTGGTIAYRKMSVKGKQDFNTDPDVPDTEQREGQFDVYIHTTADAHVIIAIRGSNEVIEKLDAINIGTFALGTLKAEGA